MKGEAALPWRFIADAGDREPRRNLALEEALARCAGREPTIRLWRNDRCVVVGRGQVAAAEVDADACRELDVPVLRRFTGGGAVFHDPGNLNITIVMRRDDRSLAEQPDLARVPGLYRLLLEPLADAVRSLGVSVRATERDLLVGDRKVSGVAAWIGRDALLVHGTLLIDADLTVLDRVLDGPGAPGDPRWERTRSRRVPVTSLASSLGASRNGLAASAETAIATRVAGAHLRRGRITRHESETARLLMLSRYGQPGWHRSGS